MTTIQDNSTPQEDDGTRWAVIDTDTDACLVNNLNRSAAEQFVLSMQIDGLDCFMELAR